MAFALPFTFEHDDYVQILTDIADQARPGARLAAGRLSSASTVGTRAVGAPSSARPSPLTTQDRHSALPVTQRPHRGSDSTNRLI